MRAPVLAIVGRPNVGKSTLFNRLAGRRIAIVEDMPGVTRDRLYADYRSDIDDVDVKWTIIDTGGFEPDPSSVLFALVREQTELAIGEADVIVHVVDAQLGLNPDDIEVASMLRRSGRPIIMAANKIDHEKHEPLVGDLYGTGTEMIFPVSASHGRGVATMMEGAFAKLTRELQDGARAAAVEEDDEVILTDQTLDDALDHAEANLEALERLNDEEAGGEDGVAEVEDAVAEPVPEKIASKLLRAVPEVLRIAVVGRPNAGKSSFVNKLLGEDRHLVSEMAGTTMDAVDSFVEYGGSRFRVIDTAGIRRKRSISHRVEKYAVVAALRGMDRADIVLHLIDAVDGVTEQDKRIASFVEDKGKACVIVINKWDLAKEKDLDADTYAAEVRQELGFIDHAPIRFISAKTGKRVHDVLQTASDLAKRHFLRVSTSQVNKVLLDATASHQPPIHKGKRVRLYFATQVKTAPPTFVVATNDTEGVHFTYRRYLINQLREAFDFGGAPIRIIFRRRDGDRLKSLSPAQKTNRDLKRKSEGHQGKTAPRRKGEARNEPQAATTRGSANPRNKSVGTGRAGATKATKGSKGSGRR